MSALEREELSRVARRDNADTPYRLSRRAKERQLAGSGAGVQQMSKGLIARGSKLPIIKRGSRAWKIKRQLQTS
jgi:hypothetical protein